MNNKLTSFATQYQYQAAYTPANQYFIPAGKKVTKMFRPRTAGRYGFNRILVGATNPHGIIAEAELNEETRLFRNVHLETIRRLFIDRTLESPFVIEQNRTFELTLENTTSEAQEVTVQLAGFDDWMLKKWYEERRATGQTIYKPGFFYGMTQVGALEEGKVLTVNRRSENMLVSRIQAASDGDDDIRISMRDQNADIKQNLFLKQLNDEFQSKTAIVPYRIDATYPLEFVFDNRHQTQSRTVSVMLEAYVDEFQ